MAVEKLGMTVAQGCAKYARACGRTSILFTKQPKITSTVGLRLAPTLQKDVVSISKAAMQENPTIKKLLDMGIKEADARILVKALPEKELLKNCDLHKHYDMLDDYVKSSLDEYNELCKLYGRSLDIRKTNTLNWVTNDNIGNIDIMGLTRKHRALRDFSDGKIASIPKELIMTEQDKALKAVADNAFKNVRGTQYDMLQYRGELISRDLPYTRKLETLKEGEIFDIPGYAWTTDSAEYAFRSYADCDLEFCKVFNKMKIKYHILFPPKSKIMASRPRKGQEFITPCDSNMKLLKRVINEENREMTIYCEHIPFG